MRDISISRDRRRGELHEQQSCGATQIKFKWSNCSVTNLSARFKTYEIFPNRCLSSTSPILSRLIPCFHSWCWTQHRADRKRKLSRVRL
ncbi:hypothetical protein VTO42DRAFT_554 [Malbranchea cinnamomea]